MLPYHNSNFIDLDHTYPFLKQNQVKCIGIKK